MDSFGALPNRHLFLSWDIKIVLHGSQSRMQTMEVYYRLQKHEINWLSQQVSVVATSEGLETVHIVVVPSTKQCCHDVILPYLTL